MKGHTYRYFKGEPLYPFGYGLSYSTFAYSGLTAKRTAAGAEVQATVKNTSSREGEEVVQLYIAGGSGDDAPIRSLLQRAVVAVLNAIYEEDFLGFSYGFRPKRSQ